MEPLKGHGRKKIKVIKIITYNFNVIFIPLMLFFIIFISFLQYPFRGSVLHKLNYFNKKKKA